MKDKMRCSQMDFYAYHGVHQEEKTLGQRFLVDVELELDLREAGESDDLEDTVNYAEIFQVCQHVMLKRRFHLIEAAAERLAQDVLHQFNRAHAVTVSICKPSPPIAGHLAGVSIQIRRHREEVAYREEAESDAIIHPSYDDDSPRISKQARE